ncbi:FAD-binding oxidoreductase [Halorussus sp. AFM4]|uniref:FAD-binding oxidoreductase n=1 Tax=Halorussus sp. AFM4 TaxID=3421651 RepID=UPI003EB91FE6
MRGAEPPSAAVVLRDLPDGAVEGLRRRVRGGVRTFGEDGYDEARRVWNGLVNRYPAVVVRCAAVADVVAAVNFARTNDLVVAVRGGGHNVAGDGVVDDGVVIDLSEMKGIDLDPGDRRVRVEPGVRLGELLDETQQFGLAVPAGMASDTGVSGSTLGGGMGWLRRKYGLGVDSLLSATVVTADGEVVVASESRNEDLFWALRGGGGNFGVVTSFEFRLHPVGPEVATAMTYYADPAGALESYREYAAGAPDEVTSIAFCTAAPDDADVPEDARGEPALGVMGCYAGSVEDGEPGLAPLRDLGDPVADYSEVTTFRKLHESEGVYPRGRNYYWKSMFLDELTDECVDRIVEWTRRSPSDRSSLTLWQFGGEMSRVDAGATAFAGRDAAFMLSVEANWDDRLACDRNVSWAREAWADLRRFSPGGLYVNFAGFGEEGEELVRAAYGDNYDRLAAVKREYDPDNLFRHNRNVRPAE